MTVTDLHDSRLPAAPMVDHDHPKKKVLVLLLPREGLRPLFYSEPALEEREEPAEDGGTLAGRIRARLRNLGKQLQGIEKKVPKWLQSTITWVKSRVPGDERLMRSLRTADAVTLMRPESTPCDDALSAWTVYLQSRARRHGWGLAIYGILLIPTTFLAALPGPNVFGYWFAYRVFCHALALFGVVRTLRGTAPTVCVPSDVLVELKDMTPEVADRIQEHFGLRRFRARMARRRRRLLRRKAAAARGEA